jgi:hypothetical protein
LFSEALPSTEEEDIKSHVDLKITASVDVKGLKKVKREHSEVNEHLHWIEIKNVRGEPGWAYGEAEFFAFEIKDYWIVVAKKDLQEFISNNVKKEVSEKPALYKLYRRQGRKDYITQVTSYDLLYIATRQIKK